MVGGGSKDVARQGVLSALRSDEQPRTAGGFWPGVYVRGLGRNTIPTADWLCACGHHERVRGRAAVIELTTRACVGKCPHITSMVELRRAS
ncbi:hypothetical protein FNJ62_29725 [Streptomyces benahoarensis]|uniref:Uncharacterized protein n=2 Tax=Streptomyces benahoarensis TaxID=2595054 RepID=A0A553XVV8_9ACTN|nr:hypothetical protein FNJ62_29725 [Streptomyces benahoarensis]TSB21120.1 hypothetical protein FNZ23_28640 [Streptomyces benahoarensis]